MAQYDIVIVGSGIVGSATALALAKNTTLKIALLEAQATPTIWQAAHYDHRVSAISLASKHILQNIGAWAAIQAKRLTPYIAMHVWDEGGAGQIDFNYREVQRPALGYIIEDSVIRSSLQQQIMQTAAIDFVQPIQLTALKQQTDKIELITENGKTLTAKLLIAADGANSWVRNQAGIALKSWDYGQTAIVATIETSLPHQFTAWQRFLTTGPLAFLPLADSHTCSIVWSALHNKAHELLELSDDVFCEKLTESFAEKLGKVTKVSKRYHFPLQMRHAKNYVQEHLALIGDAAHTIHPLAGQGVNMGLLDAAGLVDVIIAAMNKRRDFSSLATLRKYERWRKADNLMLLTGVDLLRQLFIQQNPTLKNLRNAGLTFVNQSQLLKNWFARYALGERSELPRLAKCHSG